MNKNNEFIPLYRDIMFKKFFGTDEYIYLTKYIAKTLFGLTDEFLDESYIINGCTLNEKTIGRMSFKPDVLLLTKNYELISLCVTLMKNNKSGISNILFAIKLPCVKYLDLQDYLEVNPSGLSRFMARNGIYKSPDIIDRFTFIGQETGKELLDGAFSIITVDLDSEDKKVVDVYKDFEIMRKFIRSSSIEEMENIIKENDVLSEDLLNDIIDFMNRTEVIEYNEEH